MSKKVVSKTEKTKKASKKKKAQKGLDQKVIKKEIQNIIADILNVSPNKVTMKADFVHELGMDSMMALEILACIEKTFKIRVEEEDLLKMTSFESVIALTEKLINEKS